MTKPDIKIGIWCDDNQPHLYRYSYEIKKILHDLNKRFKVVLTFSRDDTMFDTLYCISKVLNIPYILWLSQKPKYYAQHLREIDYNIFNKALLEAKDYDIVSATEESDAISSQLDTLMLLREGKIYMAQLHGISREENDGRVHN